MFKHAPCFAAHACLVCSLTLANHTLAQTTSAPDATVANTAAPNATTTTSQQPPNGVEIEIGIGSRIGGPAIGNYKLSSSGVLSLTNLGRATPQLLTRLGFSCDTSTTSKKTVTPSAPNTTITTTTPTISADNNNFCNNQYAKHVGVFLSVQFGAGSSQTISGYSVGMTYALYKNLRILAGFSLTPINEISPGFANAAAQYVTKNSMLFPGVNPANLASNAYNGFDGIQTTSTAPAAGAAATSSIYYPGSVTETHYRVAL